MARAVPKLSATYLIARLVQRSVLARHVSRVSPSAPIKPLAPPTVLVPSPIASSALQLPAPAATMDIRSQPQANVNLSAPASAIVSNASPGLNVQPALMATSYPRTTDHAQSFAGFVGA